MVNTKLSVQGFSRAMRNEIGHEYKDNNTPNKQLVLEMWNIVGIIKHESFRHGQILCWVWNF